jgi:CHAT domain-containing protein
MGHYYRLLLEGRGRAEALQLAQARIAADPEHPEWEHPVYWAAFVAAGAWGPVADRMNVRSTAAEDQA